MMGSTPAPLDPAPAAGMTAHVPCPRAPRMPPRLPAAARAAAPVLRGRLERWRNPGRRGEIEDQEELTIAGWPLTHERQVAGLTATIDVGSVHLMIAAASDGTIEVQITRGTGSVPEVFAQFTHALPPHLLRPGI